MNPQRSTVNNRNGIFFYLEVPGNSQNALTPVWERAGET
ncbi:hypothetical protein GXM_06986 [Nostoc sphaeroides CCNUC1]|uniref:Uncharacterized protein n=1 Tax=Nostoc sphaeroides CCNUC1 TaxID=2653204 RepID=A0A5P8WA80_9NOSO|nr:hypothetical protein GXM_06986 [Nostoc sphaeroides CCNUC1]